MQAEEARANEREGGEREVEEEEVERVERPQQRVEWGMQHLSSCPCGGWCGDLSPWPPKTNPFLQIQETRKKYFNLIAPVT